MPPRNSGRPPPGQVRIIGGRWRGRRLRFSARAGLRPTPDRIRETLFNWIQPAISGAVCLDLFAGSGVLGLEALSRGAAQAVMVERDSSVGREIRAQAVRLAAEGAEVVAAEALTYLRGPGRSFDIVFLDPPFESDLLGPCCERLEGGDWLVPGACIYLEARGRSGLPALPGSWRLVHSRRAGGVGYYLARRDATPRIKG